jgi:ribonuclease HI
MEKRLTIHTDGGSRGNPGPAAIGVFIEQDGIAIKSFGKTIGDTTNNVAEYTAVIEALQYCTSMNQKPKTINFFLDSKLVVEQLNGNFKIKDSKLRELSLKIRILEQEVGGVITYHSIPREKNKEADREVNLALDEIGA